MGWLFGKKKAEPRIPFPEGRSLDEKALRFPSRAKERVIEPETVKAAAGVEKENDLFAGEEIEELPLPPPPSVMREMPAATKYTTPPPPRLSAAPLYVKIDVYQKILGELESMRSDIIKMQEMNTHLQNSEYNEENNFGKLRRFMRGIHDDLLKTDKILFKT